MAETVLDHILIELRQIAAHEYSGRGELKNLRVVGHTPKNDHFIYDVCADLADGSEKLAVKVYRSNKCGGNAKAVAKTENANLQYIQQAVLKKKLSGIPPHSSPDARSLSQEHLAARPQYLPVLRRGAVLRRTHAGPRGPALPRRLFHLGEPGGLLPSVQSQEGQPPVA